ncbi:MAG: cellulase family glycosylhydrolase [Rhodocyclales bacterium]|nr:cellulase family glycosylhydrolase [Rhodocyclales bacterium]
MTRTTLTVSGSQIITPVGTPIKLRGFQGLGAYPIPDHLYLEAVWDRGMDSYQFDPVAEDILRYSWTDFDIQEIKRTGANVIRLWTRLYEIKRGPAQYSETALRLLENTINRFGEQGIYTILVMAGAGENNYEPQQRYLSRGINLWDPASSARADSIEVWGVLAQRFAGNPHVAGYDVMNEPMPPSAEALHDYYVDTMAAIRAHDPDHIIILAVAQGHRDTFQIGGDYDDDNIAVTFHFYEPHNFTLEPDLPDQLYPGAYNGKYWDGNAIAAAFDYAMTLPQLQGRPIYIGEFGAGGERDGFGGLEWTTDVLNAMNARGLHYTYHQYRHSVHRGYWTRRPEVNAAITALANGIMDGTRHYADLTEQQKRELFMTELSCDKRPGIEGILTAAFNDGR